jgi:hypothetical protein
MSSNSKRKDYFAELPKSAQEYYEKEMGREGYNKMMWRRNDKMGIGKFLSDEEREEKRRELEQLQKKRTQTAFTKALLIIAALVMIAYLVATI